MKAIVYTQYGPPDVLQLQEVDRPSPQDDEVLVKVHAASVNFGDVSFVKGEPFMVRLMGAGLLKPKYTILGSDIAGRVEAVGNHVTQFQPGDEVFGDVSACGWGGYAEDVSVPEHALALKPANLSFEEKSSSRWRTTAGEPDRSGGNRHESSCLHEIWTTRGASASRGK